jgi:hypothetical protein
MIYDPIRGSLPESTPASTSTSNYPRYPNYNQQRPQPMGPPVSRYVPMTNDPASTSDAEMLLGLQASPFIQTSNSHTSFEQTQITSPLSADSNGGYAFQQNATNPSNYMGISNVGDMMLESQEIDITAMGDDMMPWLEYLPQDVLNFFDAGNSGMTGSVDMADMGSNPG